MKRVKAPQAAWRPLVAREGFTVVTKDRWLDPLLLNVAPGLTGLPLASSWRRGLAMAVDLACLALLSGVGGL